MRYLDYWRRHAYAASLLELEQLYEPFSPDSDLLTTRVFSAQEKLTMQKQVVEQMRHFLVQANFEHVDPSDVKIILTKDSYYGLDLQVDLGAFEEILIFYRGATTMTERRRTGKRLFLWHEEVKIPVFQRLFLLFKLKPFDVPGKRGHARAGPRAQGRGEGCQTHPRPTARFGQERLYLYEAL